MVEEARKYPLPENFKKLSKKDLRKAYLLQRSQNIMLRTQDEMARVTNSRLHTLIEDLQEALSRRRQLCNSMQELVNRGQPKSIEDMADSLLTVLANEEGSTRLQWSDMNDQDKDRITEKLMKIIS